MPTLKVQDEEDQFSKEAIKNVGMFDMQEMEQMSKLLSVNSQNRPLDSNRENNCFAKHQEKQMKIEKQRA